MEILQVRVANKLQRYSGLELAAQTFYHMLLVLGSIFNKVLREYGIDVPYKEIPTEEGAYQMAILGTSTPTMSREGSMRTQCLPRVGHSKIWPCGIVEFRV